MDTLRRIYCLTALCLGSFTLSAQTYLWSTDSALNNEPGASLQRHHELLRYHDPLMYLVFPFVRTIGTRLLPLVDGEGKNGYWLEGQLGYRFTGYRGKYYSQPWKQRLRLTLDVGVISRLTRDESSPLLPMNNKFGPGLDILLTNPSKPPSAEGLTVWTTIQVHHYSNGHSDTFFIDHPTIMRNNYTGGDFSNNYGRAMITLASNAFSENVVSVTAGYHQDMDLGGPLERSPELDRYYGKTRLLLNFQFTKKPSLTTLNFTNRSGANQEVVKVTRRRQVMYRSEMDYIVGDLGKYPRSNKNRLGWHHYLTYMPSVSNEIGFMLHGYYGRDYLNIRFDDPTIMGAVGLFVKFNAR